MDVEQSDYYHKRGVALNGYDVVSYHESKHPSKGKPSFACVWSNVLWLFGNQDHLEKFTNEPLKYAPQYGGFCAFGVSNGYKASTKPEAFSIVDGKLYFNFAKYVKRRWLEKQSSHIESANKYWNKIKKSAPIKAHPIPIWWKYQFLKLTGKDLFG